ncbi:PHD finger protein 3 isoform X2 [Ambystoma mexicanum]|uniref:PHD finger protein 3 isoform X2 n=1 Tax=Ambystoma mexicanum TaxID=8296 RepID=UPI0037E92CE8
MTDSCWRRIVTEPVRNLRQSTVAKRSNTAPALSPKKPPAESASIRAMGGNDTCLMSSDPIEYKADPKPLRRSIRRTSQSEQATNEPLPVVKKSMNIGDEIKKEPKGIDEIKHQERSKLTSDALANCSFVPGSQSDSNENKIKVKPAIGTPFEHVTRHNFKNISMVEHDTLVDLIAPQNTLGGDGDYKMEEIMKSLKENSSCELAEPSSRTLVTLEEGPAELTLSCSVGEESVCSPWLETSVVKHPLLIKDCKMEGLVGATHEGKNISISKMCLKTLVLNTRAENNVCASEKAVPDALEGGSAQDYQSQNNPPIKASLREKRQAKPNNQAGGNILGITSSKCTREARPKRTKSVAQSLKGLKVDVQEKCIEAPEGMNKGRTRIIQIKVIRPVENLAAVHGRVNAGEPAHKASVKQAKPVKTIKRHKARVAKAHGSASRDKVSGKQEPTAKKKAHQTQVQKPFSNIMDDQSKLCTSSPNQAHQTVSLHTHSHPEYTGHSNQRHIPIQLTGHLKASDQAKEDCRELKDPAAVEHLREEERNKLKKGLPPRQRRSSKSISLDEPPLFIPDNLAAVKKDGVDHSSAGDHKNAWVHGKLCASCKKHHVNRFMVGCWGCDDWFHSDCVGMSLSQAQQMRDDGKEYICLKCSVDENKKVESFDQGTLEHAEKTDPPLENRIVDYKSTGISKEPLFSVSPGELKQIEEPVKHKVKHFYKDLGDSRNTSESKALAGKTVHSTPIRRASQNLESPRLSSEEKNDKLLKHSPNVSLAEEKLLKSGTPDKQEGKKKTEKRLSVGNVHPTTPPAPKQTVDQIRQSVRQTLKDILVKRLSESSSKIPEERAAKVAAKIEKELFSFYRDIDTKYKSKYRSLTFNLRDPKNNILYKRVLKGDISPDHLIRMSPGELASKELAAWRQRENRHTIEMIEKEQRDVERRPITKITHKGEIEIESESSLKEAEVIETEETTAAKPVDKVDEIPEEKEAEPESPSDTTSQHKRHLFDLNCKICTGRMAPPSDDLSPKPVKVAVGVARKHSDNEAEHMEEDIASALSTASSIIASDIVEAAKPESPKADVSSPVRPKKSVAIEDESTFLARLSCIWKGFVNMPSVARFAVKAYPVSGSLEYLTEDLPDSIQVGGRISPQTVWDYVEKIKATGTKETCLIRFCPVSEEDQISYTLLFAYFSSRRRYGVVANNMRQVKDMYLIPLGASEKVPRFLAPFDGPGLESRRPNLLLALIIRQRSKRLHSTSLDEESLGNTPDVTPEKRTKNEVSNEEETEEVEDEDENEFFNSFTTVLHKNRNRSQELEEDDDSADFQTPVEPVQVMSKSEPPKPLRFLPGVLVGWENQSSTLELVNKPLPVDDILQSLLGDNENVFEHSDMAMNEKSFLNEEKTVSEVTTDVSDIKGRLNLSQDSAKVKKAVDSPVVSSLYALRTLKGLSLKGKPPDVSTETFLENLSAAQSNEDAVVKRKEKMDGQHDVSHASERTAYFSVAVSTASEGNMDNNGISPPVDGSCKSTRSTKFVYIKRDPRQAAGRKQNLNSSDVETSNCIRDEESQHIISQQHIETSGNEPSGRENKQSLVDDDSPYKDNMKPGVSHCFSATRGASRLGNLQNENTKHLQGTTLLQNMDSLQSFGRGSSGIDAHLETRSTTAKPTAASGDIYSSPRHPPSIVQSPKLCPSLLQFPAPQNYPPMFGFPPNMPPPLLPPPGYGFPRGPPLRFRSLESGLQNSMVSWTPGAQRPGHPNLYFGPRPHGYPLVPGQPRYLEAAPQLFHRDNRLPGRRHSEPWDGPDLFPEQGFSRDNDVQRRQRFYSESYYQRKIRLQEKEFQSEKRHDRDSERNRRRERDRSQDDDRERKGKDDSRREKDRSQVSHSDRITDSKTHKESKNTDKHTENSKREHGHEKDKGREKNRDGNREGEKDRGRHHKDEDQSDRVKHKR